MYMESDKVKEYLAKRRIVSLGDNDLSRRPTAAKNAWAMFRTVLDIVVEVGLR